MVDVSSRMRYYEKMLQSRRSYRLLQSQTCESLVQRFTIVEAVEVLKKHVHRETYYIKGETVSKS